MPTTVAGRVKSTRYRIGLSRRELALLAGLAPSTVSRIERGTEQPRKETIEALAQALHVAPDWLYGWAA